MPTNALTVAWISDYPLEWIEPLPGALRNSPRQEAATWLPVLLEEFKSIPQLRLHVIALRKTVAEDFSFERDGVVVHVLKVPAGTRSPSIFWVDTLLIKRCLRQIKPDLVHAWGSERGEAIIASRLGYPFLATVQGLMTWYRQVVPLSWHQHLAAWLEWLGLRRARVITAESRFAVRYLRRLYPKLLVHQIEHAPKQIFHEVVRHPRLEPVQLVNVGTICWRKGSDLLLRALNQLVDSFAFELTTVGKPNPAMLANLKTQLKPSLWRRIHFTCNLTPNEIASLLSSATLSILPTRADTSPNAVKEAVVAGVPVVASRVGGIPDYVVPNQNGLLFPRGNLDELIGTLKAAIHHPLFGRGAVDASCLHKMKDYLSPRRMAQSFLRAYQAALHAWDRPLPDAARSIANFALPPVP
ncbi:MAG: glycosyltransferase family 4 protein [Verrucomicrobiota bacterium]